MMTAERFVHYTLGHEEIDKEHWDLFVQFNIVISYFKTKELPKAQSELETLIRQLDQHYHTKMDYMESINFKYREAHIDEHNRLMRLLTDIYLNLPGPQELSRVSALMQEVFVRHVDEYDRQYMSS